MFGKRKTEQNLAALLAEYRPPVYNTTYIMQEIEYRPCYVNGKRALFHRWANNARPKLPHGQQPAENARYFQYRDTKALVEYEDGTVEAVWPSDIHFADGGHFRDYAWLPAEALREGAGNG